MVSHRSRWPGDRHGLSSFVVALAIAGCSSSTSAPAGTGGQPPGAGGSSATSTGGQGTGGSSASGGATATGGVTGAAGSIGSGGVPGSTGGSAGAADGGAIGGRGGSGAGVTGGAGGATPPQTLAQLQQKYVDLRFGMFLHFGILTYTGSWAQPNLPISMFNPVNLDPGQWASAAVSAHMTYGVLITRHHDGFALWPSRASTFNVGSIPWMNGKGDVVRAYVDAFRARGLLPGLYYSIWDSTEGIGNGNPIVITPAQLAYVKTQLTELLTNYGPIPILVIDGWSWKMGHGPNGVAFQEIHDLVKSLQPNCLLTDHTHLASPWEVDIVNFEEPTGQMAPADNTYAANQEQKINAAGGNDWFWAPNIGSLLSVSSVVNTHLGVLEPRWTNFLLNCPPNRDGLLDPAIVTTLGQVGAAWSPNLARPPLPPPGTRTEFPYKVVAASATSGTAANAIDGINDTSFNSMWVSAGALPQSITLDLGQTRPDVGTIGVVPRYANQLGTTDGNITSYAILVSTDGTTFTMAATGTWPADGKMKFATFGPVAARYVRLEARAVNGTNAAVTEISLGARR